MYSKIYSNEDWEEHQESLGSAPAQDRIILSKHQIQGFVQPALKTLQSFLAAPIPSLHDGFLS